MNSALAEITIQAKAEHEAALAKIQEIQKEEQWRQDRKTRFTSSEYGRLMGYENDPKYDKVLTKGGMSYAYAKYLEEISTEHKSFSTGSTEWDNENEVGAAERTMEETGLIITHYGKEQEFIELGNDLGCTPDGLIGTDGGFESKCPDSKTQDSYLNEIRDVESFKKACGNYYWQVQGSMYLTGRSYWLFVSYDPAMKREEDQILILKVPRNDQDIEKLKTRLRLAIAYKNKLLKQRENRKPLRIV